MSPIFPSSHVRHNHTTSHSFKQHTASLPLRKKANDCLLPVHTADNVKLACVLVLLRVSCCWERAPSVWLYGNERQTQKRNGEEAERGGRKANDLVNAYFFGHSSGHGRRIAL